MSDKKCYQQKVMKMQRRELSLIDGNGEMNPKRCLGRSAIDMGFEAGAGVQLVKLELRGRKHFRKKEM